MLCLSQSLVSSSLEWKHWPRWFYRVFPSLFLRLVVLHESLSWKKKSILFAAWMIPSSRKFSIYPGVLNRQVASRLRKGSSQGSMPYSWAAPLGSYLHSSSMGLNTLKGKSQAGILRILAVQLKKNLTCIFLTLGELISKAVHTQLQWLCKWGLSDKEENQYDTHWGLIVLQKFSRRKILVPNFERREVRFCSITGIS